MEATQEKLWNRDYNKVMFINFALYFSFYLLTPLLPVYLSEHFDASKDMIGLVLSGYTVAALFVRPFSGYFVDSFNRKAVLLTCLALYTLIFASYLTASTLVLFAIVRTLHGGPYGASTVANSTVAIDVLPSSRRSEGIGYYGLSNNIATAIAPTAGILIYKYIHNFDWLFVIAFATAAIGFAVAGTINIPEKAVVKNKQPLSLDRFFLTKGWMIGINIAFFGFCYGLLSNYLAIYSKERLGAVNGTGTFFLLLSIGLILSRLQGSKSLKEGKLAKNAALGIIISTIGYFVFVAFPSMPGYYATALLIGLGNGHLYPAFQNMMIDVAHHNERGTANSTLLTSWDLGFGIGILLGGVVAEFAGYDAAFWMNCCVHVIGLILFFTITRAFFERRRLA
ncbi:MAG: MFS transporter [Bacteroidales bacterium]